MAKGIDTTKSSEHAHHVTVAAGNNTNRNFLLTVVSVLVLLLAFGAGMAVQHHERTRSLGFIRPIGMHELGDGPHMSSHEFFGATSNTTALSGKITAVNGTDFILDQNGTSKTIKTDSNTHFGGVGIGGLKNGETVSLVGTANSDGSIQAAGVRVTSQ